ncbi:hypothetical protein PI124_g22548 [Phytophthora idaei]|nr:hypothetical protein PI125_g24357 [Phytophthora idaei]KAG3126193.1 hypothetical protein PI126_g22432 [Phytophthora idaei]KAG3232366.1 hypothetical protein PI124_g22548 [Phytophthora idaei]
MAIWAGEEASFLAGELAAVLRKKQTGFTQPFAGAAIEAMILPLVHPEEFRSYRCSGE